MKLILIAATACLGLLAGSAVQAHEVVILPTEIIALDATVEDGAVVVSGDVAFGGQAIQDLGSDPAGDNTGGAASQPLGVDITGAQIYWPDPGSEQLLFEIRVAQLPPAPVSGMPETVQYNWDVAVDGGADQGGANWSLKIMRTRVPATQSVNTYGALFQCTPTDTGFSCSEQVRLSEIEFLPEERVVRAGASLAQLGATRGSVISSWSRTTAGALWIGASASGQQTLIGTWDAMGFHDDYAVPGSKAVQLGIAPAGEEIEFTTPATLTPIDLFSGTLPLPETPGTYTVGARACFAGNCHTETIDIEV